jgi:hypothetical protein
LGDWAKPYQRLWFESGTKRASAAKPSKGEHLANICG